MQADAGDDEVERRAQLAEVLEAQCGRPGVVASRSIP
jgi:hypothetical protein